MSLKSFYSILDSIALTERYSLAIPNAIALNLLISKPEYEIHKIILEWKMRHDESLSMSANVLPNVQKEKFNFTLLF
jgi:hypothetical protein